MANEKPQYEFIAQNVRLSYPHLAKPATEKGDDGKEKQRFGVTIIFDKSQVEQVKALKALAEKCRNDSFPIDKRNGVKLPIRKGDEEFYADKPGYGEGTFFTGARNNKRPACVIGKDNQGVAVEKIDEVFYPGCRVHAKIRLFPTTHSNIRRICASIEVVKFSKNDERLGPAVATADDMPEGDDPVDGDGDASIDGDGDLGM